MNEDIKYFNVRKYVAIKIKKERTDDTKLVNDELSWQEVDWITEGKLDEIDYSDGRY